ncbi:MAG: family 20 glycosylhydrolase [Pedobacter sp.]|nr:family 20 glycosylhydrolase [Pedobacter sp.]
MKISCLIALIVLFYTSSDAQSIINETNVGGNELVISPKPIGIIPEPVSIVKKPGMFTLPSNVIIHAPATVNLTESVQFLKDRISQATGYFVGTSIGSQNATINLVLNKQTDAQLGIEGYKLNVTTAAVTITANNPNGIFYGIQSFLQLLPPEIESKEVIKDVKWQAPCVSVVDYPKLGWRGLMLDVSRHFFTKEEVKHFIDGMSRYKYNILHLHLTDDEGWRIEIKGFPKLTEVGAWNVKKVGTFGEFIPPTADEPKDYGGFYTQDDIRELVEYAQERFVNIMPEIDVPGHSLAAIVSYPELSCTADAVNYRVRSGEQIMDWSHGAPPIGLVDNSLCPAKENNYAFLDSVITQVAKLFPFEYIHMGGDEAAHNFWEKDPMIKELMKREGLKTIPQVQAYFEKRVEKIVNAKGKKFMGWDEILEGGVSQSASVMSWRGTKYGIDASNEKHNVVMSPTDYSYFDYMQGDAVTEPKVYASLRLNKVYQFNPVPEGADPKYILGGQANLWTEQVYNYRQVEYMLWPRGFAMAEALWSPQEKKNWTYFVDKTEAQLKRLDFRETKYSPAMFDAIVTVKKAAGGQLMVNLATEVDGLDIYYSFDNSTPDYFYPKYTAAVAVPKDASLMRIITYRGKKPIGRLLSITVNDLKSRTK